MTSKKFDLEHLENSIADNYFREILFGDLINGKNSDDVVLVRCKFINGQEIHFPEDSYDKYLKMTDTRIKSVYMKRRDGYEMFLTDKKACTMISRGFDRLKERLHDLTQSHTNQ